MTQTYLRRACMVLLAMSAIGTASSQTQVVNGPVSEEHGIPVSRLDTRMLFPQIDTTYVHQPRLPENPMEAPKIGEPNPLRPGAVQPYLRGNREAFFPGIGATGWVPPDCTLAVGANNIVSTVNSSIAFFTKAGALQFQQTSETFFAGLGAGTFQFDPKCFYDRVHQRFVVVILEQDAATQVSKLLFAVSDDADPNGTWYRYRIESRLTVGTTNYWLDYPGFGYNKDAYVVSGNMFGFSSGWAGVQFVVIPSAPVLTGGAASRFSLRDTAGASAQMCEMMSSTATNIMGVAVNTTSSLKVYAIQNLTGTPTWTSTTVPVPSFSTPTRDANSTNARTLDSLDGRIFQTSWRANKLVASHGIQSGNLRARWYEVNTGTWPTSGGVTLAQSGDISSTTVDYHMPAINQNAAGDISLIFTRSSTAITADIMMAGRKATDAAGTMGTPTLLESSAGNNYSAGRWGDYFKVDVDPVNDNTFWGVSMNVNSSNGWKTSIFSWTVSTGATIPAPPTGVNATAGNAQVTVSWTASSGATSYNVKRSTTSGGPYTTVGSPTGTSFTNTGLTNGTTYFYVVTAVNSAGESGNSAQVSGTPNVSIPSIPTGLIATAGNAQVSLSWNASSGATSYNVKRATTSGGPYTTVGSPTTTSFVNTGLTNGTTYYYVVSAVNSAGQSGNSAQVSATPQSAIQLLLNPGFESGAVNWTQTAGVIDNSTGRPARTGLWKAWLNGYGTTHTDSLYQQVTIPSTATVATLTFWVRIDSAETTTTVQYDKLQVQLRNSANTVLTTLATYSNLNKNSTYVQKSFNVLAWKGQTVRVYLLGTEDSSLQTSFVCDDFALTVN
jgi:hypothetical protein